MQSPSIGRIVIYRSRTGDYDVPAIVTATVETLNEKGVELGHVPELASPDHVHLTVFTPGKPGMRRGAEDFIVESPHGRSENVAGCYQEWNIPLNDPTLDYAEPGTWRWPQVSRTGRVVPDPLVALRDRLARLESELLPREPSDDEIYNRSGVEGGIAYSVADTRDEHDPSL